MNIAIKHRFISCSVLFSLLLLLFVFSNVQADAFKCIDKKGNTIFQDSECADNTKETKIEIKKYTSINFQCLFNCESTRKICIAELSYAKQNTNKGLLLCEKAKQACDTRCFNPALGRELEVYTAIERSSYERDLRNKQAAEDESKYQKERKEKIAQWEKKRKQRHCRKYEKKLAKIQARWENKQRYGWKPKDEEYYRQKIDNAKDEVVIECQ